MTADPDDQLTPEQRRAVHLEGPSVALGAGAGCGKTTVLTRRFLRSFEGPSRRPVGSVVALTFTDKAARELRGRVRADCRARVARGGPDRAAWRSVLRGLEAAPIGNFHAFCVRVIRRFAVEAGVDPGFAVADAAIASTLRDEALAATIRRWLASRDPDLIELAVEFGLDAVRAALATLIDAAGTVDLAPWAAREPAEVIEAWRSAWVGGELRHHIEALVADLGPALECLGANATGHPKMRVNRAFLLEHVPTLADAPDPIAVLERIVVDDLATLGGSRVKAWSTPSIYEAIKTHLESTRKLIKQAIDRATWDPDETLRAAEIGRRFARLAVAGRALYDEAKRSRGLIDFDDLLRITRDLLRDHGPSVRDRLAGEVGLILVDEFQDTDPIQAEILERLAGDDLGAGRLYLVGDFKQSIYRFRGAEPRLFKDFRARFPAEGRLDLSANFRSVPGVLDFVNALFASTFPDDPPLVPGRPVPTRDDGPAVGVALDSGDFRDRSGSTVTGAHVELHARSQTPPLIQGGRKRPISRIESETCRRSNSCGRPRSTPRRSPR